MAYISKNNAYSTLAAGITAVQTSLQVAAGHGDRFPVVAGSDYTYVTLEDTSGNIEIVKVTARASASDTMTIERAQEGTTARAWNSGDVVEHRLTAGVMGAGLNAANDLATHLADAAAAHAASAISYAGSTGLAATDVEAALDELDNEKAAATDLAAHINDTSAAHAASAISFGGAVGLTATDVEGALDELAAFVGGKQIQSITAAVAANALTLTLNECTLAFRSSTLSDGTVNLRSVASPISLVISSGSTLGTVANQAARIVLIAIDNAGTVELAAVNLAGGNNLDEATLISTTAEGGAGAADSANVIYSTTARTNVPFRVVGFIDITEAVAGTWATAPTTIQGRGGQALATMQSFGYGQTMQGVAASRSAGTTYYNTTGKPIFVNVALTSTNVTSNALLTINGVTLIGSTASAAGAVSHISGIVPPGGSYSATVSAGTPSVSGWAELR